MSLSAKHRVVDNYIRAYRQRHGTEPTISEAKGFLWVDGKGGYLIDEIEEMTEALIHQRLPKVAPVGILVEAH